MPLESGQNIQNQLVGGWNIQFMVGCHWTRKLVVRSSAREQTRQLRICGDDEAIDSMMGIMDALSDDHT